MAVSIGNRHQPDKSKGEKPQERQERPSSNSRRRNRVKLPRRQDLRTSSTLPEPRPKTVSLKPSKFKLSGGQPTPRPQPRFGQLHSVRDSRAQPRQLRTTQNVPLPQYPNPYDPRTQGSGYPREAQGSGARARNNPWAVNSSSKLQDPRVQDTPYGRNGYSLNETPTSPRLNRLTPSPNRRRESISSRNSTPVSDSKRLRQTTGLASSPQPRNYPGRRPQKRSWNLAVYVIRLLILGIGIGVIAGTLLSALDPSMHASDVKKIAKGETQENPSKTKPVTPLPLAQEILPLKAQLQALVAQNPTLQPGVFVVDLDSGTFLDWQSSATYAAASTIKVPILVAFFQDVDEGKIRLDEMLTLQPEMIATGSGDLQYKSPGTQYTALEVATKMIRISDNSATNMLIARLGGAEALNQRFRSWGLAITALHNPLPDVEGTNTTSPQDLAKLMTLVNQGELMSLRSRDRLLDIMQRIETESHLPQGLGAGATIAHKTGRIGELLAEVGLVDMPNGKRYIIAVMVKRADNDARAQELIRQISRLTYDYFNQPHPTPTPSTSAIPSGRTASGKAIAGETLVKARVSG